MFFIRYKTFADCLQLHSILLVMHTIPLGMTIVMPIGEDGDYGLRHDYSHD